MELSDIEMDFYIFCSNFKYINGCDENRTNCLSIFYNLMLVLGKKRTCFLIQPIDYKNPNDFKKIIEKIEKFDNITQCNHLQGRLIYLKSNLNYVTMVLSSNPTCQKKLGFLLSYPCYNHEWTDSFASFCIEDTNGLRIILFSNWCRKLEIFENGIKQMGEYLKENFNCKYYIQTNIRNKIQKECY